MQLVFTPVIAGKQWNGATIYEEALGGSEAAVVYLARGLARRGHDVTVFTHGQPGTFEDVTYRHINTLHPRELEKYEIHISSRWLEILDASPAPWKVFWAHDMPGYQLKSIDARLAVFLTEAHANAWGVPLDHPSVTIIGDGVDTSLFSGHEERDENRLIWISNPDRGLYLASKIFVDEILPRWPDLRLHVFGRAAVYGWEPEQERKHLPPQSWVDHGDIILHEPLPRLALARELMKSWAMFYPTFWPETFSMAALEAQAAGAPVITTPTAGLVETVKGGILTNDFVNAVSQLRNANRWEKLSKRGKDFAEDHSWAKIALRWEKALLEMMENDNE